MLPQSSPRDVYRAGSPIVPRTYRVLFSAHKGVLRYDMRNLPRRAAGIVRIKRRALFVRSLDTHTHSHWLMGPPSRSSAPTMPNYNSDDANPKSKSKMPQSPAPNGGAGPGMSTESRYYLNLRLLQKRDPTITSIFDQFSHVCVYKHGSGKWDRFGCEGSMLLFERRVLCCVLTWTIRLTPCRSTYPPYGLFIFNRVEPRDYIQLLYPEDDMQEHGDLAIIRSYPELLEKRLNQVASIIGDQPPPDPFSNIYSAPGIENLCQEDKGSSRIIALWSLKTPSRDSVFTVLQKYVFSIGFCSSADDLSEYTSASEQTLAIRMSCGTGLASHRLRIACTAWRHANVSLLAFTDCSRLTRLVAGFASDASRSESETDQTDSEQPTISANASNAELDRLFSGVASSSTQLQSTPVKSNSLLDTLFLSATATMTPPPLAPPGANTGIKLLDSIFASAAVAPSPAHALNSSTSTVRGPQSNGSYGARPPSVYDHLYPTPSASSYAQPPPPNPGSQETQVLTQDVISTLLGFQYPTGATRPGGAPVNGRTRSASLISHPSSREGDCEESEGVESDGMSANGSGRMNGPAGAHGQPPNGNGRTLSVPSSQVSITTVAGGKKRIKGDVTPRPPPSVPSVASKPTFQIESVDSVATVRGEYNPGAASTIATPAKAKPRANRPLVPFEPDSELWPYSNGKSSDTDGAALANGKGKGRDRSGPLVEDDEIVELDFAETSVLSDPLAFENLKHSYGDKKGRGGEENGDMSGRENGKKKAKRSRRKDKQTLALEKAQEQERIENSWDVVPPSMTLPSQQTKTHDRGPQILQNQTPAKAHGRPAAARTPASPYEYGSGHGTGGTPHMKRDPSAVSASALPQPPGDEERPSPSPSPSPTLGGKPVRGWRGVGPILNDEEREAIYGSVGAETPKMGYIGLKNGAAEKKKVNGNGIVRKTIDEDVLIRSVVDAFERSNVGGMNREAYGREVMRLIAVRHFSFSLHIRFTYSRVQDQDFVARLHGAYLAGGSAFGRDN